MSRIALPEYAHLNRDLPAGMHPYLDIFPGALRCPAMKRITPDVDAQKALLKNARINLQSMRGYAFVDVDAPAIVLATSYYQHGSAIDLYMDLLHELTHLRQHDEGMDLWDERYSYVDRITEIEGYAVAVEEGRRLGMTGAEVVKHLSNPWMTSEDVQRLVRHIDGFLANKLDHPEFKPR